MSVEDAWTFLCHFVQIYDLRYFLCPPLTSVDKIGQFHLNAFWYAHTCLKHILTRLANRKLLFNSNTLWYFYTHLKLLLTRSANRKLIFYSVFYSLFLFSFHSNSLSPILFIPASDFCWWHRPTENSHFIPYPLILWLSLYQLELLLKRSPNRKLSFQSNILWYFYTCHKPLLTRSANIKLAFHSNLPTLILSYILLTRSVNWELSVFQIYPLLMLLYLL